MKASWMAGLSFGLTSGVITTLGLIVGLHAGTHSRAVVLSGITTIAVADALSDALGIHLSEESKNSGNVRHVWESTAATLVVKFGIALTFLLPVLSLPLQPAMVASLLWGLFLLTGLSYALARVQGIAPWKVIGEHVVIAVCVVVISHYVGDRVQSILNSP